MSRCPLCESGYLCEVHDRAAKSLVDDLAEVLAQTVVGWESIIGYDLSQAPEVRRVLARYRKERKP